MTSLSPPRPRHEAREGQRRLPQASFLAKQRGGPGQACLMSRPTAAMTKASLRQPLAVSLNINHRNGPTELKLGDEFEEERRRGLVLIHK